MALDDHALDILFRTARTKWEWTDAPVTDDDLTALYDLLKLGPTSANSSRRDASSLSAHRKARRN